LFLHAFKPSTKSRPEKSFLSAASPRNISVSQRQTSQTGKCGRESGILQEAAAPGRLSSTESFCCAHRAARVHSQVPGVFLVRVKFSRYRSVTGYFRRGIGK